MGGGGGEVPAFMCVELRDTQAEGLRSCVFGAVKAPAEPAHGCVVVDVRAVSLNMPDLLLTVGKFTRRSQPPFVLGQEGAGVVTAAGPGCARLRAGDRVLFGSRAGTLRKGAVELAERQCFAVPDDMPLTDAACVNIAFNTAYNALVQQGRVRAGETMLVLGATGGTGLAAVQLGKALGATVIAVGGSDAKLAAVRRVGGADHCVCTATHPAFAAEVRRLTGGRGVDVVFDPVGGEQLREAIKCARNPGETGARVLVLGFASEYEGGGAARNRLSTRLILAKELNVIGVGTGLRPERMARVLGMAREGRLPRPCVSHVVPFARTRDGLRLMLERRLVGKVVVDMTLPDDAPVQSRL